MRGRVSSINGLFIGSSNDLGAFYAGSMARLLGLVPPVVLGGCVTLGVVGVTSWRAPKLRRLDLRELQTRVCRWPGLRPRCTPVSGSVASPRPAWPNPPP